MKKIVQTAFVLMAVCACFHAVSATACHLNNATINPDCSGFTLTVAGSTNITCAIQYGFMLTPVGGTATAVTGTFSIPPLVRSNHYAVALHGIWGQRLCGSYSISGAVDLRCGNSNNGHITLQPVPLENCPCCAEDSECADNNACNGKELCVEGACVGGTLLACDDEDACTLDTCDPAQGCLFTPVSGCQCDEDSDCTDDNVCTGAETCINNQCVPGTPLICDDGNPCTDDSCDQQAACQHIDNILPCDDGSACTNQDTCSGGACLPGEPLGCNDGDNCTVDTCDPALGCLFTPVSGCQCDEDSDCTDNNVCTGAETCANNQCVPGTPLICDDGNPCTDDSCDQQAGCQYINNTLPCDDNNACTARDNCGNGDCQPGEPLGCNDGDNCTVDTCDPAQGCLFTPVSGCQCDEDSDCLDNNVCTGAESCVNNQCVPGTPLVCDDGNPCTDDLCDDQLGCYAAFNIAPCDDGNACTTGETCMSGYCSGGDPIWCDDGRSCTYDFCDYQAGCIYLEQDCNDFNACTEDSCIETIDGSACTHSPVNPDDGKACTIDNCDPHEGVFHTPVICDDNNPCTIDSCDNDTGCVYTPVMVDDGNACTADSCDSNTGEITHDPIVCNDGLFCTTDSCDPQTGCVFDTSASTCDDHNPCTIDTCTEPSYGDDDDDDDDGPPLATRMLSSIYSICQNTPIDPGDGNECTQDSCDVELGVVNDPEPMNGEPCQDGAGICSDGQCILTSTTTTAPASLRDPDGRGQAEDPRLCLSRELLDMGTLFNERSFTVSNCYGGGILKWEITEISYAQEGLTWITAVTPENGEATQKNPSQVLVVVVNRQGLPPGTYSAGILVDSDGGQGNVTVIMTVPEPAAPAPEPEPGCTSSAQCDDGIFCNGAEDCSSGACTEGPAPCGADQRCAELLESCFDRLFIFADSSLHPNRDEKELWHPLVFEKRCVWLRLKIADGFHFNSESVITCSKAFGEGSGVSIDLAQTPGRGLFADVLWVPICIEKAATAGQWKVEIQTTINHPVQPYDEVIEAQFIIL